VAFRVVDSFYKEHKQEVLEMIRYCGKPAYIEILSDMKHYWVLKHEINTIDGDGGVCQVSTVQLDIKDASLYGIEYVDQDGQKKGCTIVHSSIGSPERWLFSILEDALKKELPELPLWLAPTQIRILPVSNKKHLTACEVLMNVLASKNIRVDIDDRSNALPWRIRQSEREWIPYQIVIGDKEIGNPEKINVRVRGGKQGLMDAEMLINEIKTKTKDMPWIAFPARYVSKRPVLEGETKLS
jgi:threonyl-tRNA synthetase